MIEALRKAREALAQWMGCFPDVDDHHDREAIAAIDAALNHIPDAGKMVDPWRDTVDDMLTVCHMVTSDDPRESVNRLINWHVAVALDPSVSSDAQALIDKGRADAAPAIAEGAAAMKVYERICLRDWHVEAENGDRQDVKRGNAYTTSKPHGDGTVTVFSSLWVRAPEDIFEPFAGIKAIGEQP